MIGSEIEIRLPKRHAGAREVIRLHNQDDGRDSTILIGGRKWYKTSNLHVPRQTRFLLQGEGFIHLAPVYDQVMECYNMLRKAAGDAFDFKESKKEVHFRGAVGVFRSLEKAQNVRSKNAAHITVDEIQDVKQEDFEKVVLPISLNHDLDLFCTGTANGYDWVDEYATAESQAGTCHYHRVPTKGYRWAENGEMVPEPHPLENDRIPFERIARFSKSMTRENIDQEFGAKKVTPGGAPYAEYDPNIHLDRSVVPHEGRIDNLGVDFGINTFAACFRQYHKPSDVLYKLWDVEYHNMTTKKAIEKLSQEPFIQRYMRPGTIIGPDPAGTARTEDDLVTAVDMLRDRFPNADIHYSHLPRHRSPEWRLEREKDRLMSHDGHVGVKVNPETSPNAVLVYERSRWSKTLGPNGKPKLGKGQGYPEEHSRDAQQYGDIALYETGTIELLEEAWL